MAAVPPLRDRGHGLLPGAGLPGPRLPQQQLQGARPLLRGIRVRPATPALNETERLMLELPTKVREDFTITEKLLLGPPPG